jgi:Protein of unknown function DUF262
VATSTLEQYRIADFLDWHAKKLLVLNPDFQRRAVWTTSAKILLVDTILRQLPIPKVYIRTRIEVRTKTAMREVVDGQQRLRAIIEFADNKFALSKRAREYAGLHYSDLPEEDQGRFLAYPIAVDQLVNATDTQVLEVFARLNSYAVTLNPAELRHAKFASDFKWAVHDAAVRWEVLWTAFGILSNRLRLRMLDDALIAECFGVILHGVGSGDQRAITKLYQAHDAAFPEETEVVTILDQALGLLTNQLADVLVGPLASPPHFLMLFAAVAHALHGIPVGEVGQVMPPRSPEALSDLTHVRSNLSRLAAAIEAKETEGPLASFVLASLANAHRMASRRIRFPMFFAALLPRPLLG